jgi:hypothetical protein
MQIWLLCEWAGCAGAGRAGFRARGQADAVAGAWQRERELMVAAFGGLSRVGNAELRRTVEGVAVDLP